MVGYSKIYHNTVPNATPQHTWLYEAEATKEPTFLSTVTGYMGGADGFVVCSIVTS